jgi:hypothetical protein
VLAMTLVGNLSVWHPVVVSNMKAVVLFNSVDTTLLVNKCLLLCMFAKLRKATVSFDISVLPSVCMEQLSSHWTDFHEI